MAVVFKLDYFCLLFLLKINPSLTYLEICGALFVEALGIILERMLALLQLLFFIGQWKKRSNLFHYIAFNRHIPSL